MQNAISDSTGLCLNVSSLITDYVYFHDHDHYRSNVLKYIKHTTLEPIEKIGKVTDERVISIHAQNLDYNINNNLKRFGFDDKEAIYKIDCSRMNPIPHYLTLTANENIIYKSTGDENGVFNVVIPPYPIFTPDHFHIILGDEKDDMILIRNGMIDFLYVVYDKKFQFDYLVDLPFFIGNLSFSYSYIFPVLTNPEYIEDYKLPPKFKRLVFARNMLIVRISQGLGNNLF